MTSLNSPCPQPEQKRIWLKVAIAAAMICGLALSHRLWVTTRLYPLTPVFSWLPALPFPLDYCLFAVLLGSLVAIAVIGKPLKSMTVSFIVAALVLGLLDQSRWQPWFYQYVFMLAALGLYESSGRNGASRGALNVSRLILISTYWWSGLQKLNANFVNETFPDVAAGLLKVLPRSAPHAPRLLALAIPLLEMLVAAGLLTRKYRNGAVILSVATHLSILILLIASGENQVVWPWNVAMALSVVILFWREPETPARAVLTPKGVLHALTLILFGIMPALSYVDLWDSYPSFALYSGNTRQAVVNVSPALIERLPPQLRPYIWQSSEPFFLDINRWAYGELNVPAYPEPRIYSRVAETICGYEPGSSEIRLRIKSKPEVLTGIRQSQYYDCSHLHDP